MTTHADFPRHEINQMLCRFADYDENEVDLFAVEHVDKAWQVLRIACSLGFGGQLSRGFDTHRIENRSLNQAQAEWLNDCFDKLWGCYIRPWRVDEKLSAN